MRTGPKRSPFADGPIDLRKLPRGPRAARCASFTERFCKIPTGKGARHYVKLRPWQRGIIRQVLAPGVRQALVSIPRGNGKTSLASMLATYALFADGVEGAQVLAVASDQRQAGLLLGKVRRMCELNPLLAGQVQIYRDRIYVPATDSTLMALPSEAAALQGFDPSMAIIDELHVVSADTWDSVALAAGKRERSLVLAISTPADSKESVMWPLVEHGRAGDDPSFAFVEYAAPDGCEAGDEESWAIANPALDDFLARDALRATFRTTREPPFRRFRLGQWTTQVGSWLPWGTWEDRADPERIVSRREPVVLAFDGSISDDSTALVACTVERPHHIFTVSIFEKDEDRWRVPRHLVDAEVERAFERLNVVELACDPWHWASEIEGWKARFGDRVIEFPTNAVARMGPATDRLRTAVMEGTVTHDGDEALARHVRNAVVKSTAYGDVIVKDRRGSPRKIDALVAAIAATDRAAHHAARPPKRKRMLVVA